MRTIAFDTETHLISAEAVTYRHQPDPTAKPGSAPRFPVFVGFRHEDDL